MQVPMEQPLLHHVYIGSHKQEIHYEGFNILCTMCGRFGHLTRLCHHISTTQRDRPKENPLGKTNITADSDSEWKIVQFKSTPRCSPIIHQNTRTTTSVNLNGKGKFSSSINGSRDFPAAMMGTLGKLNLKNLSTPAPSKSPMMYQQKQVGPKNLNDSTNNDHANSHQNNLIHSENPFNTLNNDNFDLLEITDHIFTSTMPHVASMHDHSSTNIPTINAIDHNNDCPSGFNSTISSTLALNISNINVTDDITLLFPLLTYTLLLH